MTNRVGQPHSTARLRAVGVAYYGCLRGPRAATATLWGWPTFSATGVATPPPPPPAVNCLYYKPTFYPCLQVQLCLASLDKEPLPCGVEEVDDIINFLSILDCKATRETSPTVTVRRWPQLLTHCEETEEDSAAVKILKKSLRFELEVMKIADLVEKCKKLVTSPKTTNLDVLIDGHLAQEFEVRWNTHVDMLMSIDKNWTQVN